MKKLKKNPQLILDFHIFVITLFLHFRHIVPLLVAERVPETCRVWDFGSAVEIWIEGKFNKAFPHFLPYLMIFQRFDLPKTHFSADPGTAGKKILKSLRQKTREIK